MKKVVLIARSGFWGNSQAARTTYINVNIAIRHGQVIFIKNYRSIWQRTTCIK
jgi:hypothetical protein